MHDWSFSLVSMVLCGYIQIRGPCLVIRAPGLFERIAKIADMAGRNPWSVVVLGSVLPEIVFVGDAIFDEVIGPAIAPLPFPLNRPSAIVGDL